jgi:DNA-binding LacI/PurR family transcriptional regulator
MTQEQEARPRPGGARATSYDVARLAGVSQSAVSRAFSPGGSVSAEVRRRIEVAAGSLGYRPNAMARGLITRRSRLIGLVLPSAASLYYPEVTVELSTEIARRGSRVLLMTADADAQVREAVAQLAAYQADGAIAATSVGAEEWRDLALHRTPVIAFNRAPADRSGSAVLVDPTEGAARLARRLLGGGARRFAFIGGPSGSEVAQARARAVAAALDVLGAGPAAVEQGDFRYESGVAAMTRLCAGPSRPDTVICANDAMALGAMDAARLRLGMHVPDDVSVCGIDGFGAGRWLSYELTTLRQPSRSMAAAAAEMLFDRIADPDAAPERRVFGTEIVPGRSARLGPEE